MSVKLPIGDQSVEYSGQLSDLAVVFEHAYVIRHRAEEKSDGVITGYADNVRIFQWSPKEGQPAKWYVIKKAARKHKEDEFSMMCLARASGIETPQPICADTFNDHQYIVMEYLENCQQGDKLSEKLSQELSVHLAYIRKQVEYAPIVHKVREKDVLVKLSEDGKKIEKVYLIDFEKSKIASRWREIMKSNGWGGTRVRS